MNQVVQLRNTATPANTLLLRQATSRLAFEVEAAERAGRCREALRLRVEYHAAMAELLARTPSWCSEGAVVVAHKRRQQLLALDQCRARLADIQPRYGLTT